MPARKSTSTTRSERRRYWSADVTRKSDALDLESGVFKRSPAAIARSLARSAEKSTRRKSSPFRSAMSMLVFFQNRAGRSLTPERLTAIDRAKDELRKLYGRATRSASGTGVADRTHRDHPSREAKPSRRQRRKSS